MPNRSKSETPQGGGQFAERSSGGVEVIRSEEQLQVGTRVAVSGRAVLRKYVVTETVTQTFQVRHEEVRLEHEPANRDDPSPASDGAMFDDRVIEMVLYREVPVVQMDVVPVERIRLHVDTVTDQVSISDDVRKEQVAFDSPDHRERLD